MKKILFITITLILSIVLISCTKNKNADIVATMYPQYDATRIISGDKLSVSLLTKPGDEAHDFKPTSKQITEIKKSKLFLFTSYEMDAWLNNNVKNITSNETITLNVSSLIAKSNNTHEDLHYWSGTNNYIKIVQGIRDTIIEIDPSNKEFYENNANTYLNKLTELDTIIINYFKTKNKPTIYFAGHNAMQSFSSHYDLNVIALSATSKPDADLSASQISTLLNEVKTANTHYLFTEELKEPRVAKTIMRELSNENYELNLLELHGYHNVTLDDFNNKVTYYDLLERNYQNIKRALGD
ncbi:metal ABC transporter substrate-binding protein [Haploplasma axanthum]|uniref:Probable zinc transport system zinc-binding lipoprotein AdcA n=1 Tax=Haploplasma axanthum TaxID=29552 RepID=A0A449BDI1_HAPAX|nr:metal ABC transporter substrate-binding protein [Haploplasma axanthum]VEU80499.1 Probable zinc transport system zinc-binding lipoprotein AdcA precursor [Haploplasma axanthum]